MDILTTIPVRLEGPDSIGPLLQDVRDRIRQRAYENFVERGAVHGHDVEDWLQAERQLLIKPAVDVRIEGHDLFVEIVFPVTDVENVTVHVGTQQIVISSDQGPHGLRVCQAVDLPMEISFDGVDAEQMENVVRFTAAAAA